MRRTNSYRRQDGEEPPSALDSTEQDRLLSGRNTPDVEAGRTRASPSPSRLPFGNNKRSGNKRRNSNPTFGGLTDKERKQQRSLCLLITIVLIPLTFVLLLLTHTFTLPFGNKEPPTTAPHGGPQHVPIPVTGPFKFPPPTDVPRNEAFFTEAGHGVVASEAKECSRMGVDILKMGGNAVDAAVTTCLCIGTLNSFSSGLGGGGFMLIRAPPRAASSTFLDNEEAPVWSNSDTYLNPSSSPFKISVQPETNATLIAIDFRETAPALSDPNMFVRAGPGSSQVGGLSVGVPGEVRGLYTAWKMYGSGRISWEDLVMPAAELAKGWRVGRELARRFRIYGSFMVGLTEWEEIFRPRKEMLVEGDYISRRNYSASLAAIAKYGPSVFYGRPSAEGKNDDSNGHAWIAKGLLETIKKTGGIMTEDDLSGYQVRVYEPLSSVYNGNKVWTTDAPSGGPVMLGMLNVLDKYQLHSENGALDKTRTGLTMHRLTEAMKFAFGARTEISDPDSKYMSSHQKERVDSFAKEGWAKSVLNNLTDDTTHTPDFYNPVFDVLTDSGTTHMSLADRWGGAVSLTSTVNLIFGSRVLDRSTGIILNDEMDDFSTPGKINAFGLRPSPFNYPEPGKRPMSSTSATIVERPDGSLYTALGGSGGSRIFGAVVQVLLNMEWGMDVTSAIEAPRLHDQLFPQTVTAETAFEEEFVDALKDRGHNVTLFDINLGVAEVQAVVLHANGTFTAASDSRKNGRAWGY